MREVEVYLVRHGESTSNVEFKIVIESIMGFFLFKNYSKGNLFRFLIAIWRLTGGYQLDSHLSELGKKQASSVADFLVNEINNKENVKVVHSGLIRAIETAHLMTRNNQGYIRLDELNEANQVEHIMKSLVLQRIHSFESWLISTSRGEMATPTYIIFGHAQYFKYLLNKSEEMRNCDIWKATALISDQENKVRWSLVTLKCRSPFSYHHPIQVFKEFIFGKSALSSIDETASTEGDRSCRICQLSSTESSERLIRPCLCRGTISYVHISCLNHWRSTSSQASYQCSVCNYRYLVQRTALSSFFSSDTGVNLITTSLLMLLIIIAGIASSIVKYCLNFDLTLLFSTNYLYWNDFWWRRCDSYFFFLPSSHDAPNLITSIFPSTFIWKYHHSIINNYISLHFVNKTLLFWLCNPVSCNFLEFFFSGLILVGLLSLSVVLLYQSISLTHLYYRNYQEFQRHQQNIVVFLVWLASVNNVTLSREVYKIVQVYGRKIAQNIGETILEPNSN